MKLSLVLLLLALNSHVFAMPCMGYGVGYDVRLNGLTKYRDFINFDMKREQNRDLEKLPLECGVINYTDKTIVVKEIYVEIEYLLNEASSNETSSVGMTRRCVHNCIIAPGEYQFVGSNESFQFAYISYLLEIKKAPHNCLNPDFDIDQSMEIGLKNIAKNQSIKCRINADNK